MLSKDKIKELIVEYPMMSLFIGFFSIFLGVIWYAKGFLLMCLIMSIVGMIIVGVYKASDL